MSKNGFFKIFILIATLAITLGSCGGDPSNTNNENSGDDFGIVGTYTYSQTLPQSGGTLVYTWVFNANKTYKITRSVGSSENTGNWSVKGKDITLTDTSSQNAGYPMPAETFSISESGKFVTLTYKGSSVSLIFTIQFSITTGNSIVLTRLSGGGICEICGNKPCTCIKTPFLARQVSAGSSHTVAIKTDGSLWAWGNNGSGRLGNGTISYSYYEDGVEICVDNDKKKPTRIGSDSDWASVSAGGSHTVAIKTDGTLWAWGWNGLGQLGDGTGGDKSGNKTTPVQIGTGYTSVSAGSYHTVAIKTDGSLWAWGNNGSGQLGDSTWESKNIPVQIGQDKWISVSTGYSYTVAIKTDSTLWAWGANKFGQLGDGTDGGGFWGNNSGDKNTPVQIGTGWASVSADHESTLAIKTNGTLWAWGSNSSGQLGDGTGGLGHDINKNTPVQIGMGWASVSAGGSHTVAIKTDGTLWAWGSNRSGQLGHPPIFWTVN